MISAVVSETSVRFEGSLPEHSAAYVDGDWSVTVEAVPALLLSEGEIRWGEIRRPRNDASASADEEAASVLSALARSAVDRLGSLRWDGVDVSGEGLVAHEIRRLVSGPGDRAPAACVDTTGDVGAITAATRKVRRCGLVILAGESMGRPLSIDLYRDVHLRGLRLIGVPLDLGPSAVGRAEGAPAPRVARIGEDVPRALWYRVTT